GLDAALWRSPTVPGLHSLLPGAGSGRSGDARFLGIHRLDICLVQMTGEGSAGRKPFAAVFIYRKEESRQMPNMSAPALDFANARRSPRAACPFRHDRGAFRFIEAGNPAQDAGPANGQPG